MQIDGIGVTSAGQIGLHICGEVLVIALDPDEMRQLAAVLNTVADAVEANAAGIADKALARAAARLQ